MKKAIILSLFLVFALIVACTTDSTINGPHDSRTPHDSAYVYSSSSKNRGRYACFRIFGYHVANSN